MNNKIYRYIDFDGVLFNTNEIIDTLIIKEGLTKEEEVRKYIKQIDFYTMITNAKQINNSIYYLQQLCNDNRYITKILSHVNSQEEEQAKISIIKEYIKNIEVICVPKQIEKSLYVNPHNAILVDDYKGNLLPWTNKGGLPIHFDPKLNKSNYPVISTLEDLDTTIEKHYHKVLTLINK